MCFARPRRSHAMAQQKKCVPGTASTTFFGAGRVEGVADNSPNRDEQHIYSCHHRQGDAVRARTSRTTYGLVLVYRSQGMSWLKM